MNKLGCGCNRPDYEFDMVECSGECKNWYHYACIGMRTDEIPHGKKKWNCHNCGGPTYNQSDYVIPMIASVEQEKENDETEEEDNAGFESTVDENEEIVVEPEGISIEDYIHSGSGTIDKDETSDEIVEDVAKNTWERRLKFKDSFQKRMKKTYGAVPWTFMEGRDPDILRNSANFGHALYVVRYDGKVIGNDFQNIFKDFITNDPGLKIFKVYYCLGTGDYYYLGHMEVGNIRFWQGQISKSQWKMDREINNDHRTTELKEEVDHKLKLFFHHRTDSEPNRIRFHKEYEAACAEYEAYKQQMRSESKEYKIIQSFQSKINHAKSKLHKHAIRFETSFKVNLDPQFKADQKLLKKGPKQLDKSWKQTASDLAHAKCREKVIRKMGRLGTVYVPVGEICSTMTCQVCGILSSPGTNYLHTCPRCKFTTIRDEACRTIGLQALIRGSYGVGEFQKSSQLNGQAFPESNGLVPRGENF